MNDILTHYITLRYQAMINPWRTGTIQITLLGGSASLDILNECVPQRERERERLTRGFGGKQNRIFITRRVVGMFWR
jgi:hypothetical protein